MSDVIVGDFRETVSMFRLIFTLFSEQNKMSVPGVEVKEWTTLLDVSKFYAPISKLDLTNKSHCRTIDNIEIDSLYKKGTHYVNAHSHYIKKLV
jgi:hypothetical protein